MSDNQTPNMDERLHILKMVEEGKITASEGAALLSAMSQPPQPAEPEPVITAQRFSGPLPDEGQTSTSLSESGLRWFKVRVTDLATGKNKTSVTMPIGLVDWGLRIGARFAPDDQIDMAKIGEMLRSGVDGKLIDVVDEDDGEHVEIYVE